MKVEATKEQLAVCARFGAKPEPPSSFQKAGVALATFKIQPLNALRHPPEKGTSGWYIWGGELSEDPNFFQPLHVRHLKDHCPQLLPYLALTPGWRVLLAPNHEDVWFDEKLLSI